MPTLNIEGHQVQVDDSFLQLSPDQQNATVDEIAKSLGPSQADQASARAQAGIAHAQQVMANGGPQADPNTGQPANVPAYSPNTYSGPGSAAMGAANATTFGFGDELGSYLGSAVSGVPRDQVLQEMRGNNNAAQAQNPKSYLAGQVGGGLAQGIATGGGGFAANAANAGGTLGRVALGSALDGALYGGAYGAGNADGSLTDRAKGAGSGAAFGGAAGFAAPYIAAGITQGAKRLISPFASSPEREAAVQALAQEGVNVTAGQRTAHQGLQYAESELGGGAARNTMERQGEQYTSAILRRAGVDAPRATPDVIDGAFRRIGQQFDDLAARNTLVPDQQMIGDLRGTIRDYGQLVPESQRAPIIENLTNDIVDTIRRNGRIPGDSYQALTSRIAKAARSTSDPQLGTALRGIRETLDDAMERSITAAGNPADIAAWQTARNQYRNLLVIEKAATGAGANAASGIISPSALRNATVNQSRRAYARGQGDFASLARAGEAVLKPLPNSGTAARTAVRNIGVPIGSAGVGSMVAGIPGAIVGAAAPYVAGRALMSRPVQAFLGNQAAATPLNPVSNALLASLLRGGTVPAVVGRR